MPNESLPMSPTSAESATIPAVTLTCRRVSRWDELFSQACKFARYFNDLTFCVVAQVSGQSTEVRIDARGASGPLATVVVRHHDVFTALRAAFCELGGAVG